MNVPGIWSGGPVFRCMLSDGYDLWTYRDGPEWAWEVRFDGNRLVAAGLAPSALLARRAAATAHRKEVPPVTEQLWHAVRDGVEKYRGSEPDCFRHILFAQGQSVSDATTYGGWVLEPVLEEVDRESDALVEGLN